jgi:uncharacterized protein (TIGR03437 family)
LAVATFAAFANAQTTPSWSQVGGVSMNLGLAGPASGPVESVQFLAGGSRLQVQTKSGRVFETVDFEHWKLNTADAVATSPDKPAPGSNPAAGIQISTGGARVYSLTRDNIFSADDGSSWVNLTGFNGVSIIGADFSALAISPSNPMDIVAANGFGVWRSLDGGLSWHSLNDNLPNLDAQSLASQRNVILANPNNAVASISAGRWTPTNDISRDAALRASVAAKYSIAATAAAQADSISYAGTADGHLFAIGDSGSQRSFAPAGAAAISRIWVDPANPQTALAAGGTKLYRTTNGGLFWDDVTGALNGGTIHGITADSAAGVVYAATDAGLFSGQVSLTAADQVPATWHQVAGNLPIAAALDARLNSDGTLTVLLDGYGVWETVAPHRQQAPRIVNSADMSDRAAAPGSLISILGANVKQAASGANVFPVLGLPSDQSSQLQVPFEVTPGTIQLAVQSDGGVWMAPLNVKQAAPALFVDSDGAPMMVLDAASGLPIDAGTPVRGGTKIQVLATGLGRVTPEWPTGVPAPVDSPPSVVAPVTAFLGGTPIQVTRATLAPTFVGNYLVELEIPALVNRGASELRIVVNGEESNRAKLNLEPGISTALK